jgi:hypothetical protein
LNGLTNTERADLLERAVATLSRWKSKKVKVVESVARRLSPSGHDRHFSTRSTFTFVINHVSWAISGGRLLVLGADPDFGYEIAFDVVESAQFDARYLSLVERFEEHTERLSTFSLADDGEIDGA